MTQIVRLAGDAAIAGEGYFCGANRPDEHLIGVSPGRDFSFEEMDVRSVEAGDTTEAEKLRADAVLSFLRSPGSRVDHAVKPSGTVTADDPGHAIKLIQRENSVRLQH